MSLAGGAKSVVFIIVLIQFMTDVVWDKKLNSLILNACLYSSFLICFNVIVTANYKYTKNVLKYFTLTYLLIRAHFDNEIKFTVNPLGFACLLKM